MPLTDDMVKWVQEHLGVKGSPAPKGDGGGGTDLKNSDFPTEQGQRKKADADALKLGKQRAEDMNQEKGEGPPEEEDGIVDAVEKKAKELFEDVREKLQTPTFKKETKPEDEAALVRFFKDMKSGTEMYAKQVKYIQTKLKEAEKYGDLAGANHVVEASKTMSKIAEQLHGGLEKAGKVMDKATKMAAWIEAARGFADASGKMKPGNSASVDDWISSLKDLWDATMPFKKELEDKWWEAALEESEAAAVAAPAMAVLSIVGSQLYIGIQALDAGVKNEEAYFKRLREATQEGPDGIGSRPPPPPDDDFPGGWKSSEEEEADDQRMQEANRNQAAQNQRDRAIQDATDEFEEKEFPKIYKQARKGIRDQINAAVRKTAGSPATDWSGCLTGTGEDHYDEKLGIQVYDTKATASADEMREEIENFKSVQPPFPYFDKLHKDALDKYVAKKVPAKG